METEQPLHHEASLLPGYVNRTLTPEEHQQVELHLQSCSICRQELQEVKTMQTALKEAIYTRPGPSPAAFSRVMNRIHQETRAPQEDIRPTHDASWWESIERFIRSLFEVRWVPALASVLIVGQAVLLLSVLGGPEGKVGQTQGTVLERGIPQGTPGTPMIKIQVAFVDTAPEHRIREVLREIGGRIIDGPSADGLYILGFARSGSITMENLITKLQDYQDIIRFVQPYSS